MVNSRQVIAWLKTAASLLSANKDYLTGLDSPIGDADHGINMDRGFQKVLAQVSTAGDKDIGFILRTAGMALVSSVGGASGPLYGTFFMDAAKALAGKTELAGQDLALLFEAGLSGVQRLGKAAPGEKTMVDTLHPATAALRQALESGEGAAQALQRMALAAEEGMKATIPLVAKKGRASYLGERAIGHQDPGATSAYLLIKALLDALEADGAR